MAEIGPHENNHTSFGTERLKVDECLKIKAFRGGGGGSVLEYAIEYQCFTGPKVLDCFRFDRLS